MFCTPHGNRNCPQSGCQQVRAASPAVVSTDGLMDPLTAASQVAAEESVAPVDDGPPSVVEEELP